MGEISRKVGRSGMVMYWEEKKNMWEESDGDAGEKKEGKTKAEMVG